MIELSRAAYDDIVYRAYGGGEAEICGVLAGTHGTDGGRASSRRPTRRRTSPKPPDTVPDRSEEQLELIERVEDDGLDVVGFYHSHPTGPTHPSETDAARATWPGHSYVICALDGYPFVGSWRWRGDDDGFEQGDGRGAE